MLRSTRFVSVFVLFACAGGSSEDSAGSDPSDTGTSDASEVYPFRVAFYNGLTGEGIAGAEVCTTRPESLGEPCGTTDALGMMDLDWEDPEYDNYLNRLTHEDYVTTLYGGYFDADIRDYWNELLTDNEVIEGTYYSYTHAQVDGYFATAEMTRESGMGHTLFWFLDSLDNGIDGLTITMENAAGESVGEVVYQNGMANTLNTELTSTSIAGIALIGNLEPGDYTLRVSHDDIACVSGISYYTGVANVLTVPIEADSVTLGSMYCY